MTKADKYVSVRITLTQHLLSPFDKIVSESAKPERDPLRNKTQGLFFSRCVSMIRVREVYASNSQVLTCQLSWRPRSCIDVLELDD